MKPLAAAVLVCVAASPAVAGPPRTIPVTAVHLHDGVVDEQDTIAFYAQQGFCAGSTAVIQASAMAGDRQHASPATAYDVAPWTTASVSGTTYASGADCGTNCLRAELTSGGKTLSLDTRGTAGPSGPRAFAMDFTRPCQECSGPAGSATVFGGSLSTPALLNVFLGRPYTDLAICSSVACPEADTAFAKLWFADPAAGDVTWRVDWTFLRVLRVSATTWYVLADECDGSQVGGLSRLTGNRSRPKTVFNGYYKLPFFLAVNR
ncbi:MAG TPA: hypothetical protein VFM29_00140 [Vicinamibacteria bacterium]|nr:hypothetical protein [Vicinamibacteria bacterium]